MEHTCTSGNRKGRVLDYNLEENINNIIKYVKKKKKKGKENNIYNFQVHSVF